METKTFVQTDKQIELQKKYLQKINEDKQNQNPDLMEECKSTIDDVFSLLKGQREVKKPKVDQRVQNKQINDFTTKIHLQRLRNTNSRFKQQYGANVYDSTNQKQFTHSYDFNRSRENQQKDQSLFLNKNMRHLVQNHNDEEQFDRIITQLLEGMADPSDANRDFDMLIYYERLRTDKPLFHRTAKEVFSQFDENNSQAIDQREFKLQSQQVGMQNNGIIRKFFKKQDLKKDGIIDFEEFESVMSKLIHKNWQYLSNKLLKQQ